ncbi:MAG: LytTR family DNA-binding domain-containing protein [Candidatus Pseudobacter hemicellulosilyticus]|uniref:LytTR family DNA-binding domain-containing protein n=1 Tax=Candidatus Pseudobacter hemicellulosilyticus TaxID=3121375 RepID=A0AAJ6BF79_9BACT|nr:MAG: LytTR family DNA-binding domain-containing protein [Pseudobacter sp.]
MPEPAPIRCIIVDDEHLAVSLLADYVEKTPGLQLVMRSTQVLEALRAVQEGGADLLFLDIQMPDLSGIQFMKIIRNSCKVILTTAYAEYALAGYEHDVVDYLLKPITFERFTVAVEKARTRLQPAVVPAIAPVEMQDHIFIKTDYRIRKMDLADIYYIEALRDYIAFHTSTGRILSLESMRNMEQLLPAAGFIRIHKSYIINIRYIDYLERGRVVVKQAPLPVGETYRPAFLARLKIV